MSIDTDKVVSGLTLLVKYPLNRELLIELYPDWYVSEDFYGVGHLLQVFFLN